MDIEMVEMIDRQAKIGGIIIDKFLCIKPTDEDCRVRDLVCALMHYATRDGLDVMSVPRARQRWRGHAEAVPHRNFVNKVVNDK